MMDLLPFILLVLFLAIIAVQLRVVLATRRLRGRPAPDFDAVKSGRYDGRRYLLYFFSAHCGACRGTTPVVESLQQGHPNVLSVDVGEHPELARGFGVMATPTLVLVEDGTIAEVILGPAKRERLAALLGDESAG